MFFWINLLISHLQNSPKEIIKMQNNLMNTNIQQSIICGHKKSEVSQKLICMHKVIQV